MIKNLFSAEKPRERCLSQGPESLSLRECLAVLLGTGPKGVGCMGLARSLLQDHLGGEMTDEQFFRIFLGEFRNRLLTEPGLGPAGQARLLVSFEIARRYSLHQQQQRKTAIKENREQGLHSQLLRTIPQSFRHSQQEALGLVALLENGRLSSFCTLSVGDDSSVSVSHRKLIQTLVYLKAHSFWLFHNHPNNDLEPSEQDIEMTQTLKVVAKLIGVPLNGHWIVTRHGERDCDEGVGSLVFG